MTRALALAVVAAAGLLLAGCGGDGKKQPPEQAARTAVEGFAKAFGDGDGKKACSLLTKSAGAAFVTRAKPLTHADDCPTAIERVHDEAGGVVTQAYAAAKVAKVTVTGSKATAQVRAGGAATSVALVKEGGRWKLTGVPGL